MGRATWSRSVGLPNARAFHELRAEVVGKGLDFWIGSGNAISSI